jgi:hypothetical protein
VRVAAWWLLALASPAFAGRPLTTEDAATLEDKACQVEAWIDRARDTSTGWLVPSCNFGAGIEWQVGFARERFEGDNRFTESYAQAKTVLRESRGDSPWGAALVLGVSRRALNDVHDGWDNPYVLVPFSLAFDNVTIHAQPGWARDRESRRHQTVWGLGAEVAVWQHTALVAEAFGIDSQRPFLRAGARWTAIKDRLEVDLTYVTRPGGAREDRHVSAGLTFHTGKLLP